MVIMTDPNLVRWSNSSSKCLSLPLSKVALRRMEEALNFLFMASSFSFALGNDFFCFLLHIKGSLIPGLNPVNQFCFGKIKPPGSFVVRNYTFRNIAVKGLFLYMEKFRCFLNRKDLIPGLFAGGVQD